MKFFAPLLVVGLFCVAVAQERVTPQTSKGGVTWGEPWAEIPESFRSARPPEWPLPTDLAKWQNTDRAKVRAILLDCLGEMPARPDPAAVKVLSREEHEAYTLERFATASI
jgi:hypothetical protein